MKPMEALRKVRDDFLVEFRTQLEERTGRRLYQTPTELDQLKLLSIRTWAIREFLEVGEVIEILVEHWATQVERRTNRKTKSLGVQIATLCGDKSEEVLKKEIKKRYPDGQHRKAWIMEEKSRQETAAELDEIETQNLKQYTRSYLRQIAKNRRKLEKQEEKLTRRSYPNNPWVM